MFEILLYAAIGLVSGFFSGLLGIGGGVIVVPPLTLIFIHLLQIDPTVATHIAVATSCSIIIFTSIGGGYSHIKAGHVVWGFVRLFALAALIGSSLGVVIANTVPAQAIQVLLAVFLLYNTYLMLYFKKSPDTPTGTATVAAPIILLPASLVACFSAIVGIGGGILNVPLMKKIGLPIKNAIGSSSVINIAIAITATFGYLLTPAPDIPQSTLLSGIIYLKATIYIACFSVLAAYLGAKLTAHLPSQTLRVIFGCLTLLFAIQLVHALINNG